MTTLTDIRFTNQDFTQLFEHYSTLIYRLMNELDLAIYIGNTLPPELQEGYAKLLVDILIMHNKVVPCIEIMIQTEFDNSPTEGTLFRSNNFCSKVMSQFAKVSCRKFLQMTCKNVVNEINTIDYPLEVDGTKDPTLSQERIDQNLGLVEAYTTKFIRTVETNLNNLPVEIYEISKILFNKSREKFPESKLLPFTMVGGFLFLRVICPALAAPETSGIETMMPISGNCRRNLILITKILQNISNNVTESKESYLVKTIPFTIEMSKKLNVDIESLCTKQFPTKLSDLPIKQFEDIPVNVLIELHYLILKTKELQMKKAKTNPMPESILSSASSSSSTSSTMTQSTQTSQQIPQIQQQNQMTESQQRTSRGGWLAAKPGESGSRGPRKGSVTGTNPLEENQTQTAQQNQVERKRGAFLSRDNDFNRSDTNLEGNRANFSNFVHTRKSSTAQPVNRTFLQKAVPKKEERRKLTQEEMFNIINDFSDMLGPSPLIVQRKLAKRLNVEVFENELGGMLEKVIEHFKTEQAVYTERAQDGTPVVYIIVHTLYQILMKDEKTNSYFAKNWGNIFSTIVKDLNKYTILFDLTGVNYNLREKFGQCFEDRKQAFTAKQRKTVKNVIVFHANKKMMKFINTLKRLFDTKALKKLIMADTIVSLEKTLGVNNVYLPEESVSLDRREFHVIKINNKGKSQERVLRLTMACLCNIDPTDGCVINTINLDQIQSIHIGIETLKMDIKFNNNGKLDDRLYEFQSPAMMEKVMFELYSIYLMRRGMNDMPFHFTLKKGLDLEQGKIKGFHKNREGSIHLTTSSIMVSSSSGTKDIEYKHIHEVKKVDFDKKIFLVWKEIGDENECEYLSIDYFENMAHVDHFVNVVKSFIPQKESVNYSNV